ncbi:uncharacterized protein PG986_006889 [Apiospora aurea]|uniref:Cx9C motif-containing protein 4, mitochondrial n=1 Tax=Apiospora aurea TaxID=335848 RepID=A0ABR1QB03_9PEZI
MGVEDDLKASPPCHPRACAIQSCLTKNNYNESKCQGLVDSLYECCDALYKNKGDNATSASCPKADLLRLKMKQRREETTK